MSMVGRGFPVYGATQMESIDDRAGRELATSSLEGAWGAPCAVKCDQQKTWLSHRQICTETQVFQRTE